MNYKFAPLAVLILLLSFDKSPVAAGQYDESQLKAVLSYKIAKFVQWPGPPSATAEEPFSICVLGDSDVNDGFKVISDQQLEGRPVQLKYLSSATGLSDCQLLYITKKHVKSLASVLGRLNKRPVLTISEIEGFAAKGGIVELVKLDNNFRFVINLRAAKRVGLLISSKLSALAVKVIPDAD